jgi:hypothetical protein
MRAFERLRHSGLKYAIESNVINEPRWRSRLNNGYLRWAMSRFPSYSPIQNKAIFERPEQSPLSQHYWEQTEGLIAAPANLIPWVVELARIHVPDSWVGVMKSFEQVLIHVDVQNPIYFSQSGQWGNPFNLPATVQVRWHFRVERDDFGEPPLVNGSSLAPETLLPGNPHPDFPWADDLWFPAAAPPSQNIHLIIGSGQRLRIVAVVQRTVLYDLSIAAKIRGFRQSAYHPMTQLAIRSIW